MRPWIVRIVRKDNKKCDVHFENEREAKAYIACLNVYEYKEVSLCHDVNDEVVIVDKVV